MPPDRVRPERSAWRDRDLSERHRLWGYDAPACDVDYLEYDFCKGVAICEWKHQYANPHSTNEPSIRAQRDLADRAGLSFFVIRRAFDMSWFDITPENDIARNKIKFANVNPVQFRINGEIEFVQFLYWLRNRVAPDHVLKMLAENPYIPSTNLDELRIAWKQCNVAEKITFWREINKFAPANPTNQNLPK